MSSTPACVWLFPGQGAQHKGMGGIELFAAYPQQVAQADAILGYSIAQLCLEDPLHQLGRTAFTQPALFVVNALSTYRALEEGHAPHYLAGHSLGEFNALHAAGCFDFETGLRLVAERSRLMAEVEGGAMAAVIGLGPDELRRELEKAGCADSLEIANINSPTQVVVSGRAAAISALAAYARQSRSAQVIPLAVSAAFHSRQMLPAARAFEQVIQAASMQTMRIPVVANVTGELYPAGDIKPLLARQLSSSVQWWHGLMTLRRVGVDAARQIGPGKAMAKLWEEAARLPASAPSVAPAHAPGAATPAAISGTPRLGAQFCARHGLAMPYVAGSMYRGIASVAMVVRAGRAGLLGFFGSGGLPLDQVESALLSIRDQLGPDLPFGMNLLAAPGRPELEQQTVDLYLKHRVRYVEASAFMQVTAWLVQYRFHGAAVRNGRASARNEVFAKVSRAEVASAFLAPPPEALLERLLHQGLLTSGEVEAARRLPVASEICIEADSGGHTDSGVALALLPSMLRLRETSAAARPLDARTGIGAAGGLGTPEAICAAFVLGAEFVVVGSINQCSPEAGTSALVKDILAQVGPHDTAYAPAGDLFVTGAKVQVIKRGTLFPARANQLYQAYRSHDSLATLAPRTRDSIERFMGKDLDTIWEHTREKLGRSRPAELAQLEQNEKARMARVFKWYFSHSIDVAMHGIESERANFQIHSGPAMGAFNNFAQGGELEARERRHVDAIASELMARAQHRLVGQAWLR